ncbi:MAG: late competence development ComFB family protein [Synechococcales cyanobacterium RU_4_20]|nr:late competence development ComFB family protein [Synechococcales cyanobacterium RU_4_20]
MQRPQVMAYALNRLPSLYVTSAKGWRQQWVRGQHALQREIETTVRHALIAVQQDPLRVMSPVGDCLPEIAEAPMTQLRMLLQDPELSWTTLVPTIQRLLVEGKMDFPDAIAKRPPASSLPEAQAAMAPFDQSKAADEVFDWNRHPLHQRA